ncbi:hypothetical protein NDN08_004311 [Rhodosorus marinus]|uniref:Nucleotide exchange factor Fes1 domain-containing protein n=1 Tax=Rhodosorus marinus TaxID=101924 RepID=A0AAV8UL15_9RHOD|nr:hypothetical protein NDN08_004311 [Rhodosorus marinus]
MGVGYGQSAPMVVKINTPTPNAESIEMAESLTKAHQVEEEISTREVLIEVESSTPERDEADADPEFRTMNDLLAWSVNATVGHKGTVNLGNLAASMNAASIDDLLDISAESSSAVEIMRATLSTLSNVQKMPEHKVNMEQVVEALQALEELCHNLDNANDLIEMDESVVIVNMLNSSSSDIRLNSAWTVATCMQNNPTAQSGMLGFGVFDKLVDLFLGDEQDAVRGKAIFALQCLAENETGRALFEKEPRTMQILEKAVQKQSSSRVLRRAFNMGEVLVRHRGGYWRPKMSKVAKAAERFMRDSSDRDVKESAANFVKTLYSEDIQT